MQSPERPGRGGPPPRPVREVAGADRAPVLFVVVDTEEEFDWNAPFSRANTSVTHVREIGRFQDICDRFGVRPIYVMDYPIATTPESIEVFSGLHRERRAEIGCHLHTWVNPPFTEEVSARNSYQANLPEGLEREKLGVLTAEIEKNFGTRPRIHKAGRYGFGADTLPILRDLGYEIDTSYAPGFDLGEDGGPDYLHTPPGPGWLDRPGGLLELPATSGLIGALGPRGPGLFPLISSPAAERFKLPGIFSRARLLERVRLTPEGHTLAEMIRLVRDLRRRGVHTFSLTLHSPSVKPGCTPYVRDRADLDGFLECVEGFLAFFKHELQGAFMSPFEFRSKAMQDAGGAGAAP